MRPKPFIFFKIPASTGSSSRHGLKRTYAEPGSKQGPRSKAGAPREATRGPVKMGSKLKPRPVGTKGTDPVSLLLVALVSHSLLFISGNIS